MACGQGHRPRGQTPVSRALPGPKPVLGLGRIGRAPLWAVVAEGLFDWLTLAGWEFPAIAALGTQGLDRVTSALRGCPRVFLAFDNDDAGREAATEACGPAWTTGPPSSPSPRAWATWQSLPPIPTDAPLPPPALAGGPLRPIAIPATLLIHA